MIHRWRQLLTKSVPSGGGDASASMNDLQRYYVDGYLEGALAAGPARTQLWSQLAAIRDGQIKAGFSLDQKYPHTKDLRPSAADYDESVMAVLFESGIPDWLQHSTGQTLWLAHIQLRIVFPGASYMDWHRDTHTYDGKTEGSIPPMHKVIVYPSLGEPSRPQLLVSAGSHRRLLSDQKRDIKQVTEATTATISSADDRCLLFETSLLHAVVPETDPRGSLRVIYAFGHEFQLAAFTGSRSLQDSYRQRLGSG